MGGDRLGGSGRGRKSCFCDAFSVVHKEFWVKDYSKVVDIRGERSGVSLMEWHT